ncbi:MAG: ABC transporter permease subunit [Pseudomonadales bacterium]|jgi:NitT/TauT family transport system permease protein
MKTTKYILFPSSGILLLLLGWHLAAEQLGELIIATPEQAYRALLQLLSDAQARQQIWISLQRVLVGILLGAGCGFALGLAAGFNATVRLLVSPLRWLLMSIPPVILVVLAMLWFGLGNEMVIFITVVLLAPGIYVNTEKAIRAIDPRLQEVVRVYQFSLWQRLNRFYIPAIAAPLCAALLIALCNAVRIVVLAEVLGSEQGIGYAIATARSNFDSHQLYAWVLLVLLLVALLEWLLLQPLQHRLTRWQQEPAYAAT